MDVLSRWFSFCKLNILPYFASSSSALIFQTTMVSRLCLLVVAACAGWAAGQETNYCDFASEHTLCESSERESRCGTQVRGSGVSSQDAATIVAMHNQLRSQVARGEETRGAPGPQPPGANIRTMVSVSLQSGDLLQISAPLLCSLGNVWRCKR